MEEMSIESMMGATVISIANIWEGPLAGDMFKGKVKTHTTLPEQWPEMHDNDNDFTEINYLNKQGLHIKTEYYQNGERTSYSVNDYNNDLLISERTTTNKQDIYSSSYVYKDDLLVTKITTCNQKFYSSSECAYYKDKKVKHTKVTHLDEDEKTTVYSVSEVFYYYDSLTNIEKIESIDYLIDEAETVISTKENSLILYAYDYKKRITKESSYDNLGELDFFEEQYFNEVGELIKDKQNYIDSNASTSYNYDKDGSLFSFERFVAGKKVNTSIKKITEKKDIELLSRLGSELEGISDNEEGRTVWSNKIDYDEIGNVIKKTTYADSEITCIQEYQITYY